MLRDDQEAGWNIGRDFTLDEQIRTDKHLGTKRVKYKPNVHSGHKIHMINDCVYGYGWTWEEESW